MNTQMSQRANCPNGPGSPGSTGRTLRCPGSACQCALLARLMDGVAAAGLAPSVTIDGTRPTRAFALKLARIIRPATQPTLFASDEADMLDRAIHVARLSAKAAYPVRIPTA